ncbi:MAG: hypothetical protein Q4G59_07705, partial [Planctomycetia bacterium]|nr:hypothetical protein [Planctomycetia bacterium]
MTQKTQKNYTESDSRKNRFDWSKTTDSSKRNSSSGSPRMEMKRSITILVLALVTVLAIGIGLTMIWLVPHDSVSSIPVPAPINPDGPREYLLIRHFQVVRNVSLLTRFDSEHF